MVTPSTALTAAVAAMTPQTGRPLDWKKSSAT